MAIPFTLSDYGDTTLEDLAAEAEGGSIHLWMGTRIFRNRKLTENVVTRAEKAGYEAIVLTLDYPEPTINCHGISPEVGQEYEILVQKSLY